MLEELARINKDKDVSLKEERLCVLIFFIFEKEHSHKYVDPNMEKILIIIYYCQLYYCKIYMY